MKRGIFALLLLIAAVVLFRVAVAPSTPGGPSSGGALPTKASWLQRSARVWNNVSAPDTVPEETTPPLETPAGEADGVIEVTVVAKGAALAGADVRLYAGSMPKNWRIAGRARTDASGHVRFFAAPGQYLVSAHHNGFAPAWQRFHRPQHEPVSHTTLALEAGLTLKGRTLQASDAQPVPFAAVTLNPWLPSEERSTAKSSANGELIFSGVTSGEHVVHASAEGYSDTRADVTLPRDDSVVLRFAAAAFVGGTVHHADGSPASGAKVSAGEAHAESNARGAYALEVQAGRLLVGATLSAESGVAKEFVVVSAGQTVNDIDIILGAAAKVAGMVTDRESKAPIAGARISALDGPETKSGSDGHYELSPLPPGEYILQISADSYSHDFSGETVFVGTGQTFRRDFTLLQTGVVEGAVVDAAGKAVVGATVHVRGGKALTDAAGFYRLSDASAGIVHVSVKMTESSTEVTRKVEIKAGATVRADFALDVQGTVTGRVSDEKGPVSGAIVWLFPIGKTWSSVQYLANDQGEFRIDAGVGEYSVLATADDDFPERDKAPKISVRAGETLVHDLLIKREDAIMVTVLEADGAPSRYTQVHYGTAWNYAEDGTVRLTRAPEPTVMQASSDGRVSDAVLVTPEMKSVELRMQRAGRLRGLISPAAEAFKVAVQTENDRRYVSFTGGSFELDVAAGPGTVTVTTADMRSGVASYSAVVGAVTELTIQLSRGTRVVGRLLAASTKTPVFGCWVRIDESLSIQTGEDGRFMLEPLASGTHALIARSPIAKIARELRTSGEEEIDLGDLVMEK